MIQAISTPPAVSELSSSQIRSDSLAIADLYGSAGAIVMPPVPLVYEAAFNPHLNDIAPVTRFARLVRPRDPTSHFVDRYA